MEVSVKRLKKEDLETFIEAVRLFEKVFEMQNFKMPETHHLQSLLKQSDFSVFVAKKDGNVVGALTTYVLEQYYTEKPLMYIYDLAVDNSMQRKGIGTKLIEEVNQYCKERGFAEVFVQADKIDDDALDFYRSTHPEGEEAVVHFTYNTDNGE